MVYLLAIGIFIFAIVIHECAHGWVAYKLGDPTAKFAGRITLNPLAHVDPIGTIIVPLFLILRTVILGAQPIIFGWAKPVPINFQRLDNPKKDMVWVGLAGPCANIIFAVGASLILRINLNLSLALVELLKFAIFLNLLLAIFNLIPIPPLDGSRVAIGLLPYRFVFNYIKLERFGLLFIFLLFFTGILSWVFALAQYLTNLLLTI